MEQRVKKVVDKYRTLFNDAPKVLIDHRPEGHGYISPATQERYKSVTFFTALLKDPSIKLWLQNRSLGYIKDHFTQITIENLDEHIAQAKLAPETEFQNAGGVGLATHAWRQEFFQGWINGGMISLSDHEIDTYPMPIAKDPEIISGCRAIKKFLKETGAIPVACELALVDDELKVGGQVDDLMIFPSIEKIMYEGTEQAFVGGYRLKAKPYLGFVDLKTSNQGKKPAYAFQVRGFYQRMIRKTFRIRPKKTYILHTSKDDGTYKLIDLTDMEFLEVDAEHLVHLSRSWDNVVQEFKPKVITI